MFRMGVLGLGDLASSGVAGLKAAPEMNLHWFAHGPSQWSDALSSGPGRFRGLAGGPSEAVEEDVESSPKSLGSPACSLSGGCRRRWGLCGCWVNAPIRDARGPPSATLPFWIPMSHGTTGAAWPVRPGPAGIPDVPCPWVSSSSSCAGVPFQEASLEVAPEVPVRGSSVWVASLGSLLVSPLSLFSWVSHASGMRG